MSHVDTPWTQLASRIARGLLARKGVSYEEATELLQSSGINESVRGVEGKISRGTYRASFFFRLLIVLGAEYPEHWRPVLTLAISDEERAKHVFSRELSTKNLDVDTLETKLQAMGVHTTHSALREQLEAGTFQFVLFLQLASFDRISGLERFVDDCDLVNAGLQSINAGR